MADTPIYHDAMFRESICLVTYIGPTGTEALILNKPIHDSDFESELLEECRGKRSYYI